MLERVNTGVTLLVTMISGARCTAISKEFYKRMISFGTKRV